MLHTNAVATLPALWRLLVIDGSHVQGPGAQGTPYRLHICMDVVPLQFVSITVTDQQTGASLVHFPLGPGDIALADRGYAYATPIVETVRKQADVILRMSPAQLPVYGGDGQRVDLMQVLREQPWETSRTIDVRVQAPSLGEVRGSIHAYRLSEEQANVARQRIRTQSRKKGHTPQDTTLFWAGWVLVFTTVAPCSTLCGDHQCPVPRQMANRDRDKTLEECGRRRQVTRERRQSIGRGLVAREAAVCRGSGAADATASRGTTGVDWTGSGAGRFGACGNSAKTR